MIKVIIFGCNGKMGQVVVEQLMANEDFEIVAGIDRNPDKYTNSFPVYRDIVEHQGDADVVIDFSNPFYLQQILEFGLNTRTSLVIATTGFSDEEIKNIEKASEEIPIFYSSNMSLGINLLISLVKKASSILSDTFDIEIIEKHHNKKVDSPSGTAYMIANSINQELNFSKKYIYGRKGNDTKREDQEIGIHAVRGGTIAGEHTVLFAGEDEILEIKHTALSKKIFANGAIKAANFVSYKEKGLYSVDDMINND